MQFLTVKNFERFQHYRDRSPPWIKLYRSLLEDLTFLALPEAAQAQLVKLWIVASTCENRIPFDRVRIAQRIGAGRRLYLTELIASGWLAILEQDASTKQANGSQPASKKLGLARADAPSREEEGETEKETETEKASSSARVKSGRELLLEQLQPSQREAMALTLNVLAQGYDLGPGYGIPTTAQVDQACREVASSVPAHQIGAKVVRGFLRNVMQPPTKPERHFGPQKRVAGWDEVA